MKETVSEEKIDDLKPNMATLEKLDLLDVTPNQTIVTAKLDGEFTLLVYDRNGESYTLNKWGRRRTDFLALNQLVEALKQTSLNHVKFLCELYAVENNKPAKLPQFIHAIKGDRDFDKIHIGIWDLLSIDGKNVTAQPFDWKLQEVEGWLKDCTHVAVVPFILPRTLQDVKDFWNVYVEGKGYEGLVIRNGKHVSKIKPTLEVDAVIIGLNKKTSYGKQLNLFEQGQITSIKTALMQPDGTFLELSDCASGITADLRTVLWKLMEFKVNETDKTVFIKPIAVCTAQYSDTFPKRREILKFDSEYKFRGYTQFISLREPRLIRFRPDKTVTPEDLRITQIPENKLPKPEEKPQPQQISKSNTPIVKEATPMSLDVPRIVKSPIIMLATESFDQVSQKLYAEKWMVNSNLKAGTLEEAAELQAKTFPCIEFQPVQLPDGKWVVFHRTTVEEWLKNQEQEEAESVIGECDVCKQAKHVEQLEQCETCALIICDTCRPNHKHEATPLNAKEEKKENTEDEEEQPDTIPIQVSFRKMYSKEPIPKYQIGDTIETDRGTQGKIIEIKEGKDHNLDGKIYIIQEETGETWIHESAIKGKPQPKQQSLSDFFSKTE